MKLIAFYFYMILIIYIINILCIDGKKIEFSRPNNTVDHECDFDKELKRHNQLENVIVSQREIITKLKAVSVELPKAVKANEEALNSLTKEYDQVVNQIEAQNKTNIDRDNKELENSEFRGKAGPTLNEQFDRVLDFEGFYKMAEVEIENQKQLRNKLESSITEAKNLIQKAVFYN